MEKRDLINILSKVKNHEMDVDEAVLKFKLEPLRKNNKKKIKISNSQRVIKGMK